MSKNRRRPTQFTPQQLLILAAVILVFIILQRFQRESGSPQQAPPATRAPSTYGPESGGDVTSGDLISPSRTPLLRQDPTDTPASPALDYTPTFAFGDFDYFVLALSWSPQYCATDGQDDRQQCSSGKELGFVLHGLWPQYEQGFPSFCSTEQLSPSLKARFANLYPSDSLFDHEWEKHGTCTGLTAEQYLAFSEQLKETVDLPEPFARPVDSFTSSPGKLLEQVMVANPEIPADAIAINCAGSGRYLEEMFVCFGKDGAPTACGRDVRRDAARSCSRNTFEVRAAP